MAVVEPSSAPRRFVASTAPSRSDVGRRRKGTNSSTSGGSSTGSRKSRLAGSSVVEPPPEPAARAIGAAAELTSPKPRRARPSPSGSRLRNPLARYLLLSVVLVVLGLCVRYLWRQLAGLVGAALILSTARRWSGGTTTTKRRGASSSAAVTSGGGKGASSSSASRNISAADGSDHAAAKATRDGLGGSTRGGGGAGAFADAPAALSRFWEDGGPGCKLLVRGPKYVVDRKKVGNKLLL